MFVWGLCHASHTVLSCTITFAGVVVCLASTTRPAKSARPFDWGAAGGSCYGCKALQLSHGLSVEAQSKHPDLASLIIVGWCSVQGVCKACILVWANGLEALPHSMSLVWVVVLEVVLWFKRYPASGPKRIFVLVCDAL